MRVTGRSSEDNGFLEILFILSLDFSLASVVSISILGPPRTKAAPLIVFDDLELCLVFEEQLHKEDSQKMIKS